MAIGELLSKVGINEFFTSYFLKQPCAVADGCQHLLGLGTVDRLQSMMIQPDANVILTDEIRAAVTGAVAAGDIPRLFIEKWSIGLRHAQNHDPDIAGFANSLQRELQGPVDVHLYWTKGGTPGFSWHYDAEDLFILQTSGHKTWEIRKNTVDPWPVKESLPKDMRFEREIMPMLRCDLAAGDWLYLPAGYWHRTFARSDSMSLSVGVMTASGLDILDFIRPRLSASLRWRQRLQPMEVPFDAGDRGNHDDEYLGGLADDIHKLLTPEVFAEFWNDRKTRFQRPQT